MIYTLFLPFLLCLSTLCFLATQFPWIHIFVFSGWLSYVNLRKKLNESIWLSFLCGLTTDLFCADLPFGFFCVLFCSTTLVIRRYQKYFSFEKISSLFLYAALYSLINETLFVVGSYLINSSANTTIIAMVSTLLICPIIDALYFLSFIYYPILMCKIIFHPKNINLCRQELSEKKTRL